MIPADFEETASLVAVARHVAITAFQLGFTALMAAIMILFIILMCEQRAR